MNESKPPSINSYQEKFLDWLTALDERSPEDSPLREWCTQDSLYRLKAYQSSYLARVTSNLSDTLFETCENLFGKETVVEILGSYFKHNRPTSPMLTDAPLNLPNWLRERSADPHAFLFADMVEVCIQRWKILTSYDPHIVLPNESTSLTQIRLIDQICYIHPSAKHDLALAWNDGLTRTSSTINEKIFTSVTGLLIGKNSPTEFVALGVPEMISPLARNLASGMNAEEALIFFSNENPSNEQSIESAVQEFFTALSAMRLFTLD